MNKLKSIGVIIFSLIFIYFGNCAFAISVMPIKDFGENILGTDTDGIVLHNNLYVTATSTGVCVLNVKSNLRQTIKIKENTDNTHRFVFYANNAFVLIYPNGSVYKSLDGYKWNRISNLFDSLRKSNNEETENKIISDIKFFKGQFYITDNEAGQCIASSNLLQFKKIDFPQYSYVYFDKLFVSKQSIFLSGDDMSNKTSYYILCSSDGLEWQFDSQLEGVVNDIVNYNKHEYILAYGNKLLQYNNLIIDGKSYNNKQLKESPGLFIEYKNKLCLLGDGGKVWSFTANGNNILYSLVTIIKFNNKSMPFPYVNQTKMTDEGLLCVSQKNAYLISKSGLISNIFIDQGDSMPALINQCFWNGKKCGFYNYDESVYNNSSYYETVDGKNFDLVKAPVQNFNQVVSSKVGFLFKCAEDNLYFSNSKCKQAIMLDSYGMDYYKCKIVYMDSWHNGFIIIKEYKKAEDGTNHLLIYSTNDGVSWYLNSDLSEGKYILEKVICDGNSIFIIRNENNRITILNSKDLNIWSGSYIQGGSNSIINNRIVGAGKTKEGYFLMTGDMRIFKSTDGIKWAKIILPDQIVKSISEIEWSECSFCYDGFICQLNKYVNNKGVNELWIYRDGIFSKLPLSSDHSDDYYRSISIKGNFYMLYSNVLYLIK